MILYINSINELSIEIEYKRAPLTFDVICFGFNKNITTLILHYILAINLLHNGPPLTVTTVPLFFITAFPLPISIINGENIVYSKLNRARQLPAFVYKLL